MLRLLMTCALACVVAALPAQPYEIREWISASKTVRIASVEQLPEADVNAGHERRTWNWWWGAADDTLRVVGRRAEERGINYTGNDGRVLMVHISGGDSPAGILAIDSPGNLGLLGEILADPELPSLARGGREQLQRFLIAPPEREGMQPPWSERERLVYIDHAMIGIRHLLEQRRGNEPEPMFHLQQADGLFELLATPSRISEVEQFLDVYLEMPPSEAAIVHDLTRLTPSAALSRLDELFGRGRLNAIHLEPLPALLLTGRRTVVRDAARKLIEWDRSDRAPVVTDGRAAEPPESRGTTIVNLMWTSATAGAARLRREIGDRDIRIDVGTSADIILLTGEGPIVREALDILAEFDVPERQYFVEVEVYRAGDVSARLRSDLDEYFSAFGEADYAGISGWIAEETLIPEASPKLVVIEGLTSRFQLFRRAGDFSPTGRAGIEMEVRIIEFHEDPDNLGVSPMRVVWWDNGVENLALSASIRIPPRRWWIVPALSESAPDGTESLYIVLRIEPTTAFLAP